MKTTQDLRIPFTWEERRPILLDRFFYIPGDYAYQKQNIPFFDIDKPIIIEYCSGNGKWIGNRAKQNPQYHWIAVEKQFVRARKIWLMSYAQDLSNLCVVCGEGELFTHYYAPQATEIFVNFPDPWPKRRHAKHRLISESFVNELLGIVGLGGKATCVTDDADLAQEIVLTFQMCDSWKIAFQTNEWPEYGGSFFRDLWIEKGRVIHYLQFERVRGRGI